MATIEETLAIIRKKNPKLSKTRQIGSVNWLADETGIKYKSLHESIHGVRVWRSGELEAVNEVLERWMR